MAPDARSLSFQGPNRLSGRGFLHFIARPALIAGLISVSVATAFAQAPASQNSDEPEVGGYQAALSTTTHSWRRSPETKFAYKIGSDFDSFANEREQSQFFGMSLMGDFRAQLLSNLTFRTKAGVSLSSGYAQSRFGDNVGASSVWLEEAYLNLRAFNSRLARFYFTAGALDQGDLNMKILVNSQPFPGVRQALVLGQDSDTVLKIWAQQTIPTSKTLSTKTVDAEVMPTFMSETIELSLRPARNLKLTGHATHYAFNNLPSAVVLQSQIYGNTTTETGPNTARFQYGFEGFGVGGTARYDIMSSFGVQVGGYMLQNTQAPEGYRNSQYVNGGVIIGLENEIELTAGGAVFFVEDDVTPGFYNDSKIGHNNRQGYSANMDVDFRRQRFKLRAAFTDADVLNFNINQTRQQAFSIGFETFYELF